MAIEKALTPNTMGEEIQANGKLPEPDLEIEIVNPDMVTLDDGSVEVILIPGGDTKKGGFSANIAEELEEDILNTLSSDIVGLIDADTQSRKEWADTFVKGLDVLGFNYEERNEPWEGASVCIQLFWQRRLYASKLRQ